MNEGERRLCDWQYNRSGSFFKALFELMSKADSQNLAKLGMGFPDEAMAVSRFKNEEEYWPTLEAEYTGGRS